MISAAESNKAEGFFHDMSNAMILTITGNQEELGPKFFMDRNSKLSSEFKNEVKVVDPIWIIQNVPISNYT